MISSANYMEVKFDRGKFFARPSTIKIGFYSVRLNGDELALFRELARLKSAEIFFRRCDYH